MIETYVLGTLQRDAFMPQSKSGVALVKNMIPYNGGWTSVPKMTEVTIRTGTIAGSDIRGSRSFATSTLVSGIYFQVSDGASSELQRIQLSTSTGDTPRVDVDTLTPASWSGSHCEFTIFADTVICVNGGEPVQKFQTGDSAFSDLFTSTEKPEGRVCCVCGDHLVLGHIEAALGGAADDKGEMMLWWSGRNDPTDADPGSNRSGFGYLNSGGAIIQMVGFSDYFLVFQTQGVHRVEQDNGPNVFQPHFIGGIGDGIADPGSVVKAGNNVYYRSYSGWKVVRNGQTIESLRPDELGRGDQPAATGPPWDITVRRPVAVFDEHWRALVCATGEVYMEREGAWGQVDFESDDLDDVKAVLTGGHLDRDRPPLIPDVSTDFGPPYRSALDGIFVLGDDGSNNIGLYAFDIYPDSGNQNGTTLASSGARSMYWRPESGHEVTVTAIRPLYRWRHQTTDAIANQPPAMTARVISTEYPWEQVAYVPTLGAEEDRNSDDTVNSTDDSEIARGGWMSGLDTRGRSFIFEIEMAAGAGDDHWFLDNLIGFDIRYSSDQRRGPAE